MLKIEIDAASVLKNIRHVQTQLPHQIAAAATATAQAMLASIEARIDHDFQELPSYLLWHKFYNDPDSSEIQARAYPEGTLAAFARSSAPGAGLRFNLPALSVDTLALIALESGATGSAFAGGASRGAPGSATRAAFERDLGVARTMAAGLLPVQRGPGGRAGPLQTRLTMSPAQPSSRATIGAYVGYPPGTGAVGSDSQHIPWVLFGTKRMVPRNYLRDALRAHAKLFMQSLRQAYYASFPGESEVGKRVGAAFERERQAHRQARRQRRIPPTRSELSAAFVSQYTRESQLPVDVRVTLRAEVIAETSSEE